MLMSIVMKVSLQKTRDKELLYSLNKEAYQANVVQDSGEWNEEEKLAYYSKKFDKYEYQLVRADDKWVGIVGTETTDTYIYLSDLKIIPDFQGKGLGSKIIKDLLSKAKQAGLQFKLDVVLSNTRAIAFYESLGLEIANIDERYVYFQKDAS